MTNESPELTGDLHYGAGVVLAGGAADYYAIPQADLARFRLSQEQTKQLEEAIAGQDVSGYSCSDLRLLPPVRFNGGIWGAVIPITAQAASQKPLIDYHGGNPER